MARPKNVTADGEIIDNPYAKLQADDRLQMKMKPVPVGNQDKLPKGKCKICTKETYHTKLLNKDTPEQEAVFICFATYKTPKIIHTRKEPSKEQLAYLLKFISDNEKLKKSVIKVIDT